MLCLKIECYKMRNCMCNCYWVDLTRCERRERLFYCRLNTLGGNLFLSLSNSTLILSFFFARIDSYVFVRLLKRHSLSLTGSWHTQHLATLTRVILRPLFFCQFFWYRTYLALFAKLHHE